MTKFERKIESFIAENGLLRRKSKVVAGLSGGPDSVCLLRVLHALGYEIVAVHCNFHLRGMESMRDERFAVELCERMGISCMKHDFDTETWAREHGVSIEMAARELRYELFRKLMSEHGCEAIAVGHHQGDSVETLLLNMARGSGIQGVCGIKPRNGDVVRPLLCVTREEIIAYLEEIGQGYVTDHTNLEDKYGRNKIRLSVIPVLESVNSAAASNMAATIENLNEVRKVYEAAMARAVEECSSRNERGELRISIKALRRQASPICVLHEILSPIGFNREQVKGVARAMDECGKKFAGKEGQTLLIDREEIIVEPADGSDKAQMPAISMEIIGIDELTISKEAEFAYLDADKVKGELTMRLPKQGDTFAPFGMGGKRKLVSDYLTDLKLSRTEKERQPLLCDGDEIVWVVGRRSSELYRVGKGTRRVIVCRAALQK